MANRLGGELARQDGFDFTARESERYKVVQVHQRDLWSETGRLAFGGVGLFAFLFLAFSFLAAVPAFGDGPAQELVDLVFSISLDLSSKVLAIIATLDVAIAVTVRSFGGPNPQPIDMARRRALIYTVQFLAVTAVFLAIAATFSSAWVTNDVSVASSLALLIVALITCVFSADANIQFGKAKSTDPGYDAWLATQEADRFFEIGKTRGLGRRKTPRRHVPFPVRALFFSVLLGFLIGLVIALIALAVFLLTDDRPLPDRWALNTLRQIALVYVVPAVLSMWIVFFAVLAATLRKWVLLLILVSISLAYLVGVGLVLTRAFASDSVGPPAIIEIPIGLVEFVLPATLCFYMLLAKSPKLNVGLLGYDFRVLLSNILWRKQEKLSVNAKELRRMARMAEEDIPHSHTWRLAGKRRLGTNRHNRPRRI